MIRGILHAGGLALILYLLSYLGGVLTIVSPCILPVLPFVFARADQPFVRSGLPLLLGMALTFAAIATLATLGGSWAIHANQYGRIAAMIMLAFFGLTLLSDSLAERLTRPLVALGDRLSRRTGGTDDKSGNIGGSLLLGVATGLLWAPCAGPILGLILTGAAIKGASASTTLLLFAYAAGAATSLAAALLIGGRVFTFMKKSLGAGEWIRRGLGVAVLLGVVAIAFGLDTGILARLSLARTAGLEQILVDKTLPQRATATNAVAGSDLPSEGTFPSLSGATAWLNSPPLTPAQLRGKVVLVDFWTYSCINCLRSLPYIRAWAAKYKDHGLVVIGVHAPEFAFEKDVDNVRNAVHELAVTYPVVLDFIDAQGRIRHHHFGEGEYDDSERIIQTLLKEAGYRDVPGGIVNPQAGGTLAAADNGDMRSPETYVGYARTQNFAPGAIAWDEPRAYATPATLSLNQWGLSGNWTVGKQMALLNQAGGKVFFRFHARDLHFVLGSASGNKPARFRVTIDGEAPGASHGADTNAQGEGTITGQRLYQLVRQSGAVTDRTFAIEFLDPGVQAFSFTFG
jgi:cytochrome c biogenesis protein CcdA/thiol-disulfide isomerase/thioredoxin